MKVTKTKLGSVAGAVGATGAVAAACAACCVSIPLVTPLFAWLGLSGLGAAATGWYLPVTGVSTLGIGAFLIARRRRKAKSILTQSTSGCGCGSSCKI